MFIHSRVELTIYLQLVVARVLFVFLGCRFTFLLLLFGLGIGTGIGLSFGIGIGFIRLVFVLLLLGIGRFLLWWLWSLLLAEFRNKHLKVLGLEGNIGTNKYRVLVSLGSSLLLFVLRYPLAYLFNLVENFLALLLGNMWLLRLPLGHKLLNLSQLLVERGNGFRSCFELRKAEQYLRKGRVELGVLILKGSQVGIIPVLIHPLLRIIGEFLDLLALLLVCYLCNILLVVD
mmetsp:Transcript_7891/g.15964  ORF Transcript_7891/g.15964 Transcript_7891/m.15964 type:complete len:231 (+) Transcript_7891:2525-3217(+)